MGEQQRGVERDEQRVEAVVQAHVREVEGPAHEQAAVVVRGLRHALRAGHQEQPLGPQPLAAGLHEVFVQLHRALLSAAYLLDEVQQAQPEVEHAREVFVQEDLVSGSYVLLFDADDLVEEARDNEPVDDHRDDERQREDEHREQRGVARVQQQREGGAPLVVRDHLEKVHGGVQVVLEARELAAQVRRVDAW